MNLIYRAEKEAVQGEETPYELSDITPVIGGEFAEVKLLDKKMPAKMPLSIVADLRGRIRNYSVWRWTIP